MAATLLPSAGAADPAAPVPPKSWIDPDTGHRVIRLTSEPDSVSFYFNDNGYTPDGREMVYTTPAGISVLNLATGEARQVVPGPARAVVVGRKTPTIYYTKRSGEVTKLYATQIDTGESREIGALPRRGQIFSVNADETLAAGVDTEGNEPEYGSSSAAPRPQSKSQASSQNGLQAPNKTQMMEERLARRLPMELYTLDLHTGAIRGLWHGTDWIDHVQFSPTDPTLLIYAHEGIWQLVDRIWMIRTDGSQNQLVHHRILENETDGHEWWGADGKNIWYQLHYPPHMQASFLASYNVETGARVWYYYSPDQTSIHHNVSPDGKLFCGDGGVGTPWIFLARPALNKDNRTLGDHLIKAGYLQAEKLVNLAATPLHGAHNYALEPNPSFSPDQKLIIFASNMFGPTYVFGVEVAKAGAAPK